MQARSIEAGTPFLARDAIEELLFFGRASAVATVALAVVLKGLFRRRRGEQKDALDLFSRLR